MKRILTLLVSFTLITPIAKGVVILPVVEDTYIQGNNAGPNGSSVNLLTKDGSGSYLRNSLLKFNLTGVSVNPVDRAYISLFITDIQSTTTSRKIDAHIIDSTWDEATVRWNDAPAKGDLAGSLTVTPPVAGQWVQLDVTDYLKTNWDTIKVESAISFSVFQNNGGLAKNYIIASKEYEDLGADPVVNAGDKAATLTIAFSNPSSLTFDGIDDYVDAVVPVSGNGLDSAFTLEASIYAPSGTNNSSTSKGRHGIFGTDYTDAWASPYLGVSDEDEIHYGFGNGSGSVSFTTTSDVLTLDAWNHVALTFDNSTDTINLYIDGVLKDTQVAAGGIAPRTSRGTAFIGRSKNDFFTGKIDEVRIWNSVRSVQDIVDYKSSDIPTPMSQSDLVAYYKFDEGEGGDDTTLLSMAPVDIPGILSIGSGDLTNKWGDSVTTPVVGLMFQQDGVELTWSVEDETGVKAYQILNAETGDLIDSVIVSDKIYSYTLEENVSVKLVVIDASGFTQTFYPENENVSVTVYDLSIGWNLIAIVDDNAEIDAFGTELWGWNGQAYELVQTPQAGQAVWVYSQAEKQVVVQAEKSEHQLTLEQGWNMVGAEGNMEVPADALVVYSWNELYQNIAKDGLLLKGVGYWIFCL